MPMTRKVLQMAGVTVGFGKRLSWPDDYFTFNADLTYNWYYLKNWDYSIIRATASPTHSAWSDTCAVKYR